MVAPYFEDYQPGPAKPLDQEQLKAMAELKALAGGYGITVFLPHARTPTDFIMEECVREVTQLRLEEKRKRESH